MTFNLALTNCVGFDLGITNFKTNGTLMYNSANNNGTIYYLDNNYNVMFLNATGQPSGPLSTGNNSTATSYNTITSIEWDTIGAYDNNYITRTTNSRLEPGPDAPYGNIKIGEDINATIAYGKNPVNIIFGISLNGNYYYTTYPGDPNILCMDFDQSTLMYRPTILEKTKHYDPSRYLYILVGIPVSIIPLGTTTDKNILMYQLMSGEMQTYDLSQKTSAFSTPSVTDIDKQISSLSLDSITVKNQI